MMALQLRNQILSDLHIFSHQESGELLSSLFLFSGIDSCNMQNRELPSAGLTIETWPRLAVWTRQSHRADGQHSEHGDFAFGHESRDRFFYEARSLHCLSMLML
jgi:hypothetical protein